MRYTVEQMKEAAQRGLRAYDYHREVRLAEMVLQLLEERSQREVRLNDLERDPRLATGCPLCGSLTCRGECFK